MNSKDQLIKNCESQKIVSGGVIDSFVAQLAIDVNLSTEISEEKDITPKCMFDVYNQFIVKLNLKIYEELITRGIDFAIIDDRKEINTSNLGKNISSIELGCYTDNEIKEQLAIPIVCILIEVCKKQKLKVFTFASLAPPMNNIFSILTNVKVIENE